MLLVSVPVWFALLNSMRHACMGILDWKVKLIGKVVISELLVGARTQVKVGAVLVPRELVRGR